MIYWIKKNYVRFAMQIGSPDDENNFLPHKKCTTRHNKEKGIKDGQQNWNENSDLRDEIQKKSNK